MATETNLSVALGEYRAGVDAWLDATKKETAVVGRLQKAVAAGNVRDVEKLRQNALNAAEVAAQRAGECEAFQFDIEAYLREDEGYLQELRQAAEDAGVQLFERDGVIFCYPVLVRFEPQLAAVRIDKKLEPNIHPAVLAAVLKKAQSREPRAQPSRFLETLFDAYELLRGEGEYIDRPLTKIYDVLTLLPGANRDYTLLDFTRDLYLLDTSGVAETQKGFRLSLPASTVSRERGSKILHFVTRDGHEKQYAAIKFTPA